MNNLKRVGFYLWGGVLHFAHRIFMPLMMVVIAYAVLLVGMHSLTPWARHYQPRIQQYLHEQLHEYIHFRDIETAWYGIYPVVKLIDLEFTAPGQSPWTCHELWLGLDLVRSILYWHWHPGLVYVDGLKLNLAQDESYNWTLQQKVYFPATAKPITPMSGLVAEALAYLPEKILLKNIDVELRPWHGRHVMFKHLNLSGQKKAGQYYWSADLDFGKHSHLLAKARMPWLSSLSMPAKGRLYLHTQNFDWQRLPGYQTWLAQYGLERCSGSLNLEAWVDWQAGQLASIQFQFDVDDIELKSLQPKQSIAFSHLGGHALWRKTLRGWELSVEHLHLNDDLMQDNQALVYYQGDWNNYHLYLKTLPLELLRMVKPWLPKSTLSATFEPAFGQFDNLQVNVKDGMMDYFLTQFHDLSWPRRGVMPGIEGLSGVAAWEPSGLHLELASDHLSLQFQQQPRLGFDHLHAVVNARQGLAGPKIEIDRLVLSRPDFALTLNAAVDAPQDPLQRNLRLQAKWSLAHGEQWLPYLSLWMPASDLRHWLQHDVKQIEKASGEMVFNGLTHDFPFEQQQGEFLINSFLYGVDLQFAKDWPLVNHINGQLRAHQRELEVKIDEAALAPDLNVKALSLIAPNLGLGHESLLIHGQLAAPIASMLTYLQQTPLAAKAKSWSMFDLKGQGDLDLRLDIPLGTSTPKVLTLGHLDFPTQDLDLQLFLRPLRLNQVQGFLDFDGEGILGGHMYGLLGQDQINFAWQKSNGDFTLTGGVDSALLQSALNLDLKPVITGHLPFQATLHFPRNNNDLLMHWTSDLQGLALQLPEPWGKTQDEPRPLTLDMKLASNQWLSMVLNYQNTTWNVLHQNDVWRLITHQPSLDGELRYQPKSGKITSILEHLDLNFDLNQSTKLGKKPWKIKDLPLADIEIKNLAWKGQPLGQFRFTSSKAKQQWLVNELSLNNPNYALLLRGALALVKGHYETHITSQLELTHLAKALSSWHITPVADCKDGSLNFNGQWLNGSLNQLKLSELQGDLSMYLRHGNISHLDRETEQKIGLGKLLSILSLQTLPRRLQLDFSDLANQGFTFDIFKGNFHLQDGMLKTDNAMMDGPIAHIKIVGGLNILEAWYDLELQVYPYITASLPVVATIAGGPLAGVATWAANHVLNQGMQKISGYTYRITGPWTQPVVQQVKFFHPEELKIKEKTE